MLKKLRALIYEQLIRGVSPQKLAVTAAVGVSFGLFPLFGFTTIFCLIIGAIFKLNHPLLQLANHGMGVIHILMIPVFLRIGEFIVGATPISFSVTQMLHDVHEKPIVFLQNYGMAGLYAVLAWSLIAPLIGMTLYFILSRVFHRIHLRMKQP
jgi:uncharacterized protein (DUF2062 family)